MFVHPHIIKMIYIIEDVILCLISELAIIFSLYIKSIVGRLIHRILAMGHVYKIFKKLSPHFGKKGVKFSCE